MRMLRETARLVLYTIAALSLRIRVRLLQWRYIARRAALRLMRRVLDWMEPAG